MAWGFGIRLLGGLGLTLFLASIFTPLATLLAGISSSPSRLERADAIVVLAASVDAEGVLSNGSFRRAVQGVILQRKGLAPLLVLSGLSRNSGPAEAVVRAQLARDLGIPPEMILTETQARTTQEEAVRLGDLLRSRGARRILLVTDSQHLPRAEALFERAGFEVLSAPADDFSSAAVEPEERLRLMRRIAQEITARLYYRLAGYL